MTDFYGRRRDKFIEYMRATIWRFCNTFNTKYVIQKVVNLYISQLRRCPSKTVNLTKSYSFPDLLNQNKIPIAGSYLIYAMYKLAKF